MTNYFSGPSTNNLYQFNNDIPSYLKGYSQSPDTESSVYSHNITSSSTSTQVEVEPAKPVQKKTHELVDYLFKYADFSNQSVNLKSNFELNPVKPRHPRAKAEANSLVNSVIAYARNYSEQSPAGRFATLRIKKLDELGLELENKSVEELCQLYLWNSVINQIAQTQLNAESNSYVSSSKSKELAFQFIETTNRFLSQIRQEIAEHTRHTDGIFIQPLDSLGLNIPNTEIEKLFPEDGNNQLDLDKVGSNIKQLTHWRDTLSFLHAQITIFSEQSEFYGCHVLYNTLNASIEELNPMLGCLNAVLALHQAKQEQKKLFAQTLACTFPEPGNDLKTVEKQINECAKKVDDIENRVTEWFSQFARICDHYQNDLPQTINTRSAAAYKSIQENLEKYQIKQLQILAKDLENKFSVPLAKNLNQSQITEKATQLDSELQTWAATIDSLMHNSPNPKAVSDQVQASAEALKEAQEQFLSQKEERMDTLTIREGQNTAIKAGMWLVDRFQAYVLDSGNQDESDDEIIF